MFKPNATASRYFHYYRYALFLMGLLVVVLSACMSGSEGENRAQGPATLKVTVGGNPSQNKNNINKSVQNKLDNADLPTGIDSIVVQVTDESGATLGEGDILATGGEIEFTVPPGIVLTITGLAYASGTLNFQAQTSVAPLLAGMSTSVELTLLPAGANASPLNVPIQIDTNPNGLSGNALSSRAIFSDNNQAVLFKSAANNLVTDDTNDQVDFFLKDRSNNRIINIHTDSDNNQADGAAVSADMSADGRVIVFESEAGNLAMNPVDTNAASDIFVKALDTNITTRISLTSTNQQAPLGSFQPTLSDDGQLAVFVSENSLIAEGTTGIYLKNRTLDTLEYLGAGIKPLLSGDGSHVIIWDTTTSTLKLHNIANKTNIDITTPYVVPEASAAAPYDINTNGQFIVFTLQGNDAVTDETLAGSSGIYLYENVSNSPAIRLISTDSEGVAFDTTAVPAITPSISGEGRYIAYAIGTTIYVKDRTTEQAVQLAQSGTLPSLSKEGRWVAYTISDTDNLYMVPNPLFGAVSDSPDTPATQLLNITLEGEGVVNSQDGNIACGEQCTYNYPDGTLVQLEAIAPDNISFTAWQGDCAGTEPIVQVTLDQARSCTAVFSTQNQTLMLTIKGGPNAGSIRSDDGNDTDPPTLICENTEGEQSICNGEFPHNQSVTLMPILGNDKNDVSWTGCDENNGLDGCTLLMNDARNVIADFILVEHTLTITMQGNGQGVVTTANENIDCGELCSGDYADQAETTLTATPAAGSLFAGWSGQCSGNDVTTRLTLSENSECIATFDLEEITFLISKQGAGSGIVSSENEAINCGASCSATLDYGQTLILTANAANDSIFKEWQGACSGTNSRAELNLTEDASCTAIFDLSEFSLSTSTTGSGNGTITSNDQAINCGDDCNEVYASGTTVTLTARAANDAVFVAWSGDEQCVGTNPEVQVIVEGNLRCAAEFKGRYTLEVTKTGQGKITSAVVGIDCGSDCSETYDAGTEVSLTAAPGSGYRFAQWGGSCSGTAASTKVTMDASQSCSAVFTLNKIAFLVNKSGTGSGTVNSADDLINCGEQCSIQANVGQQLVLIASAASNSVFKGWQGACKGTNARIELSVTEESRCTAVFDSTEFSLSTSTAGNGSGIISSDDQGINCGNDCNETYATGSTVTLTANAADGSQFTGWSGAEQCAGNQSSIQITVDRNISCVASFAIVVVERTLTVSSSEGGTVTSTPGGISCGTDCSQAYDDKTQVSLIAVPDNGYRFAQWGGSCSGTASSASVTLDTDKSCSAVFERNKITFSVSKSGTGSGTVSSADDRINCGEMCSIQADVGQQLILIASAANNSVFKEWQGTCSGTNSRVELSLTENSSCTAVFDLSNFSLSTSTTGNGSGTITSDDQGINCGEDCNETYISGATVTLTANAANGSRFTGWSGAEQCTATQPSVQLTVNGNLSCQANFVTIERTLTVVSSNGTVTSSPGINCGEDCSESYADGTQITLTAVASSGYRFTGWSGSCSGTSASTSVTMDADQSCTATFAVVQRTLTVVSQNGSVSSTPGGINCGGDCSEGYANGTQVTLTTAPNAGYRFDKWGGSCSGTATSVSVTMDADKSCTATFAVVVIQRTLTVEIDGGGSVTSKPGGISCGEDCSENYADGTQITLTAVANEGYRFDEWRGNCTDTATIDDDIILMTVNTNKSCTAVFAAVVIHQHTLTVEVGGGGSVTSKPEGINCIGNSNVRSDCNQNYVNNTTVTLTAVSDVGYRFQGWQGNCSVSAGALTIANVTMNADKICSASFFEITPEVVTLTIEKTGTGSGVVGGGIIDGANDILVCGDKCSASFVAGSRVTLVAEAERRSEFRGWTGVNCNILPPIPVGDRLLYEIVINANTTCIATFDLKPINTISNVTFDPESPDSLVFDSRVNISFNYQTTEENGVRIWARPFTNGTFTPGYAASGSPVIPPTVAGGKLGSGTQFFTISSPGVGGNVKVDQVRFQIWTADRKTRLYEIFIPVDYTFVEYILM